MANALKLLDYDRKAFVIESFLIMHFSNGGISRKELLEMPFDEFDLNLKEADRIQNIKPEEGDLNNG